jgi:hypothetical protein
MLGQRAMQSPATDLQHAKAKQKVLEQTNRAALAELSMKIKSRQDSLRKVAYALAEEKGWVTRKETRDGAIMELVSVTENGLPLYYQTDNNTDAAATTSTNLVHPGGGMGLNLTGFGMTIGEWDGADVRTTHDEFNNTGSSRVNDMDGESNLSNHATHVAGTLIGGGADPAALGMAYEAELDAYDWNSDFFETSNAAANGLLIGNYSYGYITGWRYDSSEDEWTWFGDPSISNEEDYLFGFYTWEAQLIDEIAYDAPYYLYVKSAGNDRGDWDGFSTVHPPDGGDDGFDCIGQLGNAKNILTVGAIWDLPNGYTNPGDVFDASFSSMGPTDDGRIKPDIVGNGVGLWSPLAGSDDDYDSYNGTSMSAPNVAGSLLLLQEHYEDINQEYMKAATLKGLVIATADEAGDNEGPDYKFGWGVLNTATAAEVITDNGLNSSIQEETYSNGTQTFAFTATGTEPLVATICWTDVEGDVPSPSLDPTDQILVNDLDMTVSGNGTTFFPYMLSGSNPSAAATTGVNHADNVEKIYIENPIAGETYTVEITHTGFITNGSQDYSLIVTGITSAANDLRVSRIMTLTSNGTGNTLETPIYAEVINSGGFAVSEAEINLSVTGANTYAASLTLNNLAPNDTAVVIFPGFVPENIGINSIAVTVPDDDVLTNNSQEFTQETTDGFYSYLNDDPVAEMSVGFGAGSGSVLVKFPISGTKSLSSVRTYVRAGVGNTIRAVVLDANSDLIANGENYIIQSDDIDSWVDLPLTNPVDVTDAEVFVGFDALQGPQPWFPLGVQEEAPAHPDAYYSNSVGGGGEMFGPYTTLNRWMIELEACLPFTEGYAISGPTEICEDGSVVYEVDNPGTNNYVWDVPFGWDIDETGDQVVITPNNQSGTISIMPVNGCGEGEEVDFQIDVLPIEETNEDVAVCLGENLTMPDGQLQENIQFDFIYESTLTAQSGCDSIVNTFVEVIEIEDTEELITLCPGESYTYPDGTVIDNVELPPAPYTSVLTSSFGCDSVVVTSLGVFVVQDGAEEVTICSGESFQFPDGTVQEDIQADLSYTSVLQSVLNGCDSVVVSSVSVSEVESTIEGIDFSLFGAADMSAYQWLDCDNNFAEIEGATGVDFQPIIDGNYAVQVTDEFGCTAISDCLPVIGLSTSDFAQNDILVYPNPVKGKVTITGVLAERYELYDIEGRLVRSGEINSNGESFELNFEGVATGQYNLRLADSESSHTVRIIVDAN